MSQSSNCLNARFDLAFQTAAELPKYMRRCGYQNIRDDHAAPFYHATGTDVFSWLKKNPEQQAAFSSYMACRREGKPSWLDLYPMEELSKRFANDPNAVFLVDVGGSRGHDLLNFRKRYPQIGGRLVLEDQGEVLVDLDLREERIETLEYNFLEPQPVQGN